MSRKKGILIKEEADKAVKLHVSLDRIHKNILNREIKKRGLEGKKGAASYVVCSGLESLSQTISIEEKMRDKIRKKVVEHHLLGQSIESDQREFEIFLDERKKREEEEELSMRENILNAKAVGSSG